MINITQQAGNGYPEVIIILTRLRIIFPLVPLHLFNKFII